MAFMALNWHVKGNAVGVRIIASSNSRSQISIHRKNEQLLWSAKVMMLLGSTALIMLMGQIFSNYLSPVSWWDKDITALIEQKDGKKRILVSFECETLKADKAAEDHIRQFMPKLAGLDAIVNIGRMTISGLDFGAAEAETECKI
ncbi:uncharacterized protein LOC130739420 isoform X5 [Lotus japonicus]|uniref:uncharacterized protein LOC130739420 isoform X5 n=1 Tax=Lotus japonicus TaxID=34305 RepID=UPI002588A154|nr:uncharacterized protein LOC130739420 isoform X5 [Lotus japonicus]XP_057447685.1 uncharacterized protein LOC130739420 isoform X5 [Lotus japonicus]